MKCQGELYHYLTFANESLLQLHEKKTILAGFGCFLAWNTGTHIFKGYTWVMKQHSGGLNLTMNTGRSSTEFQLFNFLHLNDSWESR